MKKVLIALILVCAAYYTWHQQASSTKTTVDSSVAQIQVLAASVNASDVVIYTTNECQYCHEAKSWLTQNGFAFTECNMSVDHRCETEFSDLGGDGTPFLVVRRGSKTHNMKNGFDTEEFLAALS